MWSLAWIGVAAAQTHTWSRDIDRLVVENASGDVHLETGGERIVVRLVRVRDSHCEFDVGERSGTAHVRIHDRTHRGTGCRIHVAIRLPRGAVADVHLGAGDMHAVDLDSQVHATLGTGEVRLEGGRGLTLDLGAGRVEGTFTENATLRVGSGHIDLQGLRGAMTAHVGTGEIHLQYAGEPRGQVSATTGLGDIHVDLPGDGAACDGHERVSAQAGIGQVRVD